MVQGSRKAPDGVHSGGQQWVRGVSLRCLDPSARATYDTMPPPELICAPPALAVTPFTQPPTQVVPGQSQWGTGAFRIGGGEHNPSAC